MAAVVIVSCLIDGYITTCQIANIKFQTVLSQFRKLDKTIISRLLVRGSALDCSGTFTCASNTEQNPFKTDYKHFRSTRCRIPGLESTCPPYNCARTRAVTGVILLPLLRSVCGRLVYWCCTRATNCIIVSYTPIMRTRTNLVCSELSAEACASDISL